MYKMLYHIALNDLKLLQNFVASRVNVTHSFNI